MFNTVEDVFHSSWIVIVYKNVCRIKNNGVWDISIHIKASECCVRIYIHIRRALCIVLEFSSDCSMKISVAWKIVRLHANPIQNCCSWAYNIIIRPSSHALLPIWYYHRTLSAARAWDGSLYNIIYIYMIYRLSLIYGEWGNSSDLRPNYKNVIVKVRLKSWLSNCVL